MAQEAGFGIFVDGKAATKDDIKNLPITVLEDYLDDVPGASGEGFSASRALRGFKSTDAFHSWISKTQHAQRFMHLNASISRFKEHKNRDHTRAVRMHLARAKRVHRELDELAKETDLKRNSREFFIRSVVNPDPIEGAICRSAYVSDIAGAWFPEGHSVPLISVFPVPDFDWFNMNDKGSSLTYIGAGVLCEDPWYEGRKFWFFGASYNMHLSLAGFSDIASSGYCIGP